MFVVQRNEDRFDQEMESDVLAVVTVSVQAPHAGQPRSQRFKILWVPFKGTRSNFIDFFRMTGHCRKADVICFLYLNNIIWPESDMALRRIEFGDHLRLQVRTEGNSWCDFEYSEGVSRSRRLFASSSPEREPEERGGQEEEQEEEEEAARSPPSDYTFRSDHRVRQRRSRSRARRRNEDRENDSPTLLHQSLELNAKLREKMSSVGLPNEGKSHVSDLWCTQPLGDLTDLGNFSFHMAPLGDITNTLFSREAVYEDPPDEPRDLQTTLDSCRQPLQDITSKVANHPLEREKEKTHAAFPQVEKRKFVVSLANALADSPDGHVAVDLDIKLEEFSNLLNSWYKAPIAVNDVLSSLDLSSEIVNAIANDQVSQTLPYVHIFTDGSFDRDKSVAAWSFVTIETDSPVYETSKLSRCTAIYTGLVSAKMEDPHWHGAMTINAYIAELEALLHAQWWALSHGIDTVTFHYDAMSAGEAAAGKWGFDPSNLLATIVRVLGQCLDMVLTSPPGYAHVKAHAGDTWNELADATAKATAVGVLAPNGPNYQWHSMITGFAQLRIERLPLCLSMLQGDAALPPGTWHTMHWSRNLEQPTVEALWPLYGPSTPVPPASTMTQTLYNFNICTFNVRSLKEDCTTQTPGSCEFIRAQCHEQGYHIVALQETRARISQLCDTPDYIRVIAAGSAGHEGCEIWFSKVHPYAKGEYLSLQGITVLHQEPTLLVVRLRIANEFLILVTAHAPHSGRSKEDRQRWWRDLSRLIQCHYDKGKLILLGDFNAQIGQSQDNLIGDNLDKTTTANGQEMTDLAETYNLWIPSTFSHIHRGEQGTWIHPGTKDEIRLDYHLLDSRFPIHHVETWIDHGIETTQQGEDHRALALQLSFLQKKAASHPRPRQIDEIAIRDPGNAEEIANLILNIPQPRWETNAHDHYAVWAKAMRQSLSERFTQKRAKPRKHYISDTSWAIRASKIQLRKQLAYSRKHFPEHCPALIEQLQLISKQLKAALAEDRKCHIETMLADIDKVPHAQLFAQLRRLGIGARFRRAGPRALPIMKGPDGNYANDQADSQEIWRQHASALEAGIAAEQSDLLIRCHNRQQQQLQEMPPPSVLHIPSLLQLEKACRRVKPFKARGPDGLPASLYHCFPQMMAKSLRPLLCKVSCQLQEPLGFKGGRLIHLYKGKGEACLPQNRRGILIANHASKVLHGSLRPNYMPALESAMLPMQLGGRPKRAVQQSAHILRLFASACKRAGRSCGIIFLDIKTAYYQVVRETVARASGTATFVPSIIAAFNLPEACEDELNRLLHTRTAANRIGLPRYLEMLLAELHTNTWFTTDQVDVLTETRLGTRPGSCFADVFFNFLFAKVLDEVTQTVADQGLLTTLEWSGKRGLDPSQDEQVTATVGETVWADDLALFLQHDSPSALIDSLQVVGGVLFDRCLAHGLQPNFSRGKTEILASLRGKGAVQLRRHWFTDNGSMLPIPNCRIQDCQVRMIAKYRHLGGQIDAKATSKCEVTARLGQVRSVFRKYKKSIFTTPVVSLQQRSALLRPFVLSILDYNLGTLVDLSDADVQAITTTILHIYRAVAKPSVTKEELFTISWPWLCHALQLPHPRAVIHLARLRYFGQVLRTAPDELWAMIETQGTWLQDCCRSFNWLYENISGSTNLPPPTQWDTWSHLICHAPRQWHGLMQRAWKHDMLQAYNSHIVDKGYAAFSDALSLAGYEFPPGLERNTPEQTTHICLQCQKGFGSRTAWASHAFKKHNRVHTARKYVTGTQCGACCKEFWEYRRLFHHLRYSVKCRQTLACAEAEVDLEPGLNSRVEKKNATEPLRPWHRAEGPPLQVRDPWAGIQTPWDEQLFDELMGRIPLTEQDATKPIDDLIDNTRQVIVETTAEFSVVLLTIRCWTDSLRDIMTESSATRADLLRSFLVVLGQMDVHSWLFPPTQVWVTLSDQHWRQAFGGELFFHNGWCEPSVPRPVGAEMYVVHLFSGRRRADDLQRYLEEAPQPPGVCVHVLSADIIFGRDADFSRSSVRAKWLDLLACGYILAVFAGPPCETFSVARANALDGVRIRPIRSAAQPWGFEHLTIREIKQVIVGNLLALFAIQCMVFQAFAGRFGCLEHPAEPSNDAAASIWKLDMLHQLYRHPAMNRIRLLQGHYGASSPKPTDLLVVGPANPKRSLVKHATPMCANGTNIGLDETGRHFKTAHLKEYPGLLCRGLTQMYSDWLGEAGFLEDSLTPASPPPEAVVRMLAAFAQSLDQCVERFGPDFNEAACAM